MVASRVYAVEDQWSAALDRGGSVDFFGSRLVLPTQRRFGDLASVRAYVEAVMTSEAVVRSFPDAPTPAVRERSGQSKAHYEVASGTIAIPVRSLWAGRETVVLHEIAHHLASRSAPEAGRRDWHGLRFRITLCTLAAAMLGDEAALLLRAGYEGAGLVMADSA